ncbi:MAG TPA: adenylate/guanylate cyclase domain-containing protein [Spirochaetia bacterium]|nr:adenylate/guanylate cyclase domain-containing protein [Spirochaetia bacterium]
MNDAALVNDLTEILSQALNQEQLDAFGRLLTKGFDAHAALNLDRHVTVPKRRAAAALIEICRENRKTDELLQLVFETDGRQLEGKTVTFSDLDLFVNRLARSGIVYDHLQRRIKRVDKDVSEMRNWGTLRDGRTYEITVASIDIVDNSRLVRQFGARTVEIIYKRLWDLLRFELSRYDGRIWSWAGDGGIIAFALKDSQARAVKWALSVQRLLPVFNADGENPVDEPVRMRIGISSGRMKFLSDTGSIVADAINYAAHLEKHRTEAESISISEAVYSALSPKLASHFFAGGEFEGSHFFICRTDGSADGRCVDGTWAKGFPVVDGRDAKVTAQ